MPQLFLSNSNSSSTAYSSLKIPNLFNSVNGIKPSSDDNWNHCSESVPIINPINDQPAGKPTTTGELQQSNTAPWNFMLNCVNRISSKLIPNCSFVGAESLPPPPPPLPKPCEYSSLISQSDLKEIDSNFPETTATTDSTINTTTVDDKAQSYDLYNLSKNFVQTVSKTGTNLNRQLSASCPINYSEYFKRNKPKKQFDIIQQILLNRENNNEEQEGDNPVNPLSIKILIKLLINYKFVFINSMKGRLRNSIFSTKQVDLKKNSEEMFKMNKEMASSQSVSTEIFPSLLKKAICQSKQMLQSGEMFAKINEYTSMLSNVVPSCNSSRQMPSTPDPKVFDLKAQEDRQRRLRNKSRKRKKNRRQKKQISFGALDDSAIMSGDCDQDNADVDGLLICFSQDNSINTTTTVITGEIDDYFFEEDGDDKDNYEEFIFEYESYDDEEDSDSDCHFLSDEEDEDGIFDYDEEDDEDSDSESDSDSDDQIIVLAPRNSNQDCFYDSDSDDENSTDETEIDDDDSGSSSSTSNDEAELELLSNSNMMFCSNFLRTTPCNQQKSTTNVCDKNKNNETTCESSERDSPNLWCNMSRAAVSLPQSIPCIASEFYQFCTQSSDGYFEAGMSPETEFLTIPLSEEEILRNRLFEENQKELLSNARKELIDANIRWNKAYCDDDNNEEELSTEIAYFDSGVHDCDNDELYDEDQLDEGIIFMIDEICDDSGNINESSPAQSHSSSSTRNYNSHLKINSILKPPRISTTSTIRKNNNKKFVKICPESAEVLWIDNTEEEQKWMKEYRTNYWYQKAVSRALLENKISLVLGPDHRKRIYRERFLKTEQDKTTMPNSQN